MKIIEVRVAFEDTPIQWRFISIYKLIGYVTLDGKCSFITTLIHILHQEFERLHHFFSR